VLVTTGPGGLNTLTGVMGQWTDSVPVVYVSGQVKRETTVRSRPHLSLRQLGDQEVDIVEVVRPLTKYAAFLQDPEAVRVTFEEAWLHATSGRPGPVWVDVPMDVQGALVDEGRLAGLAPGKLAAPPPPPFTASLPRVRAAILAAQRPVIVAGHGIRIGGARETFLRFAERLGMPLLSTFNGFDLVPSDHPLYVGRIGTIGDRAGNFAVQNADLVLCLGTRNNIRQVSYNWENFARAATTVVVDIDRNELEKPTLSPGIPVHADVGEFIVELERTLAGAALPRWDAWREWCAARRRKYPVVLPEYERGEGLVNPYSFVKLLSGALPADAVVVTGNGTASIAYFQAGIVKNGQRAFFNSGCAAMGYDLPAAIGACIGTGKRVVCLTGEGSLQMNLQELQTVVHHRLPVALFVLNNNGYHSIRQTQEAFFGLPLVGCDPASGVSFPDLGKVAAAYGIPFLRCASQPEAGPAVERALAAEGPVICEVMVDPAQPFAPKTASTRLPDGRMVSRPLEDMAPFLDRREFRDNMIIPPLPE
jgi:acetolactate synthase-1/2/3 large subunit